MKKNPYLLLNKDNFIGLDSYDIITTWKTNIVDGVKILQEKTPVKRAIY